MHSLHISLTSFKNESRILKEARSLVNNKYFNKIYIAALYEANLREDEIFDTCIIIKRFNLLTRCLSKCLAVQLVKYFEFCIRIFIHYKSYDIRVVNIHTLGLLPLGFLLKVFYRAKLVYDTHELETETNGSVGFRKTLKKFLESHLICHVDLVFVVGEMIADWYHKEYPINRPIVIMNAPRIREFSKSNIFREQLSIRDDQVILLYQGYLGNGRGVLTLLNAIKIRSDDRVICIFMGYGDLETEIIEIANTYGNIFFLPAVPPDKILRYTSSADIGVSLIENTCLSYDLCMPNKLFEYSMVGLPILVSNLTEISAYVRSNKVGVVIENNSAAAINSAIDSILSKDLKSLSHNSYSAALENAWEVQEKKMLGAYDKLELNNVALSV